MPGPVGEVGGLAVVGLVAKEVSSSEMRVGRCCWYLSSFRLSTMGSSSKVTRFRVAGAKLPERVFTSARLIRLEYHSWEMSGVTAVDVSVTAVPWLDGVSDEVVFSVRRFCSWAASIST